MRLLFSLGSFAAFCLFAGQPAFAEQLYRDGQWPAMAADLKASQIGDVLTVVIFESASASNRVQNRTNKSTQLGGSIDGGSISESGSLNFGGSYSGGGEITRSDQFLTQMTVQVVDVLANGDFVIEGGQQLSINGEDRDILVRGRIRPTDIDSDNRILSTRIADAQIDYDGKGFLTRSAKPGIVNRILNFLGII